MALYVTWLDNHPVIAGIWPIIMIALFVAIVVIRYPFGKKVPKKKLLDEELK